MKRKIGALSAAVAALALTAPAGAQEINLKLAHFVVPQHPYSKYLQEFADLVAKKSNNKIKITIFPNQQMGPGARYADLARTGQADITWFVHGFTPGRFPLTDISNVPYLFGSGEIGSKVLNEPALRAYLDKEHQGMKPLQIYTHQPGQIHTRSKPIHKAEDLKGLRIRFASPVVRDFITQLGGTPVGVPSPDIVENMQKGTLDGAFIDYGGAGIAFKLGGTIRYSTELYAYVASFGLAMNEDFWNKLPPDLKKLVIDTTTGREREIGQAWDGLDAPGKKALLDGGGQAIRFSPEDDAKVRRVGSQVTFAKIKELEDKGLPARAVYEQMRSLADKHSKTSKSFWN